MLDTVSGLQLGTLPCASTVAGVSLLTPTTTAEGYVVTLARRYKACAVHASHYALTYMGKLELAVDPHQ